MAEPENTRMDRGGACAFEPDGSSPPSRGSRAVCRHGVQRLYCGKRRKHELDRLRRGVEHDVERRVRLLDRSEDIGQEASFRKIPVLLRHLGRVRRQPQHAEGAVGAAAFDPAPGAQLGKSPAQCR